MPKLSGTARRLHPRLRVIENGSAMVNGERSEISTMVVSTGGTAKQGQAPMALGAAQLSAHNLEFDLSSLTKGGLGKRPKIEDVAKADNAFVNVIIEFLDVPGEESDKSAPNAEKVAQVCREELKSGSSERVKGAVIRQGNLVSATVPVTMLTELKQNPNVSFVYPAEPLKLDIPEASAATKPSQRQVGTRRQRDKSAEVMIGIIDVGGFDFSHPDFLDKDGKTRFVAIWDQGGEFREAPARFGYGSEFKKEQLDAALADSKKKGALPANLLEPQSQSTEASHGTHVASIAAGNKGVCPKAEIAAVLVDIPVEQDQRARRRSTFSDSSRVTHAVEYLLDLARERNRPISINISLGTNGGAHDGSSGVSRWLDARLSAPGRCICVAAGNAGQEGPTSDSDMGWIMGRIHSEGRVASRGLDVDLEWVVVGNGVADISENEMEIWYGAQDRLIALLLPPGESKWIEVKPREFVENKRLSNGTTVSIYNELYHPANGANYISIYLSPNLQPGQIRGVQAGVWRVRLRGEDVRDGSFHCWIERDDPQEMGREGNMRLFRFPSFFSEETNVDSHSISSLACGHCVVAVSNLVSALENMNVTSSQGPTRDKRYKPDIAAPGTDVVAAKGFSLDDSLWTSMTGTSMASPYVAGVIGLMLAVNPELTSAQCAGILQRTARPLPGNSYEWRNDAGFGRIDPKAAIAEAATSNERVERR